MNEDFLNNIWVIRILSLILALFLYNSVPGQNGSQRAGSSQPAVSVEASETVANVPVVLGEMDEGMFVSGLPESIAVTLTGPKALINQLINGQTFQVKTQDLRGLQEGPQYIDLLPPETPAEVRTRMSVNKVQVNISHKVTEKYAVDYVIDERAIATGYAVSQITLNPTEVTLTGKAETMAQIDRVVILVRNETPATTSFTGRYMVQVLDKDGKALDVNSDVEEIDAKVEVIKQQAELPIHITSANEQVDQYHYEYRFTTMASVVLAGPLDKLNQVQQVEALVDVKGINESTTLVAPLQIPVGLTANIDTVEVEVLIEPIQTSEASHQGSVVFHSGEQPSEARSSHSSQEANLAEVDDESSVE